jgi:putative addiction module antidote
LRSHSVRAEPSDPYNFSEFPKGYNASYNGRPQEDIAVVAVVKLRKIGNSLGFILPNEEVRRLHIDVGDELTLSQTDKGIELTPLDQEFETKLKAFEKSRRRFRNALRELAK